MSTLLRRMRKKILKICHFKESETVQREREDEAYQKPEGVPALPASQRARADKRPAAEAGEDSVAGGSLR